MDRDQCKINGCKNKAKSKKSGICQTHYHRMWRSGSYEVAKKKEPIQRRENPKGYQLIYDKYHPLSISTGYVYEHRKVAYEKYSGVCEACEICGRLVTWKNCHVDHIDSNVRNNNPENIRILCRGCNTHRNYPEQHTLPGRHAIEYMGETKTPNEWASDVRVGVSRSAIMNRLKKGLPIHKVLFMPKWTHIKAQDAIGSTTII